MSTNPNGSLHQPDAKEIPGSRLETFDRFVDISAKLVVHLEAKGHQFHSLYSVVPLVTQLLGLENPLFGSGHSPYSVISILPNIDDPALLKWDFDLSLEQRRVLIDEIYDMIAPILLDEDEAYIDLLIDTVHHDKLGDQADRDAFRAIQIEKFALLRPLVQRLNVEDSANFAHIAHYGYTSDLEREHGFLKQLPPELVEEWSTRAFPTVFELNFRGFEGGAPDVRGWIIVSNNSTEQLIASNKLRRGKILQCARLAEKLGAQTVGMAGLIASFGKGGYFLSEQFPHLGFTTGHAYTIGNIIDIAQAGAQRTGLALEEATVAIIGAAGSIGSGCAKLFAQLGVQRMVLIDIMWQEHLQPVVEAIKEINEDIQVTCSGNLNDMYAAELNVVATNSPRTIIKAEFLRPGAIVIDDSYPKNVPESIVKDRDDLIALEGGIVRLPASTDLDRARNVPNVMDVPLTRMISCLEIYGCFAETLTLAAHRNQAHYGLGPSDPTLARDILDKGHAVGFARAPLQFFGQAVQEERFLRARQIRNETPSSNHKLKEKLKNV